MVGGPDGPARGGQRDRSNRSKHEQAEERQVQREVVRRVRAGGMLIVLCLVLASCSRTEATPVAGPPGSTAPPATAAETTTSTAPAPVIPIWPLTGQLADPVALQSPVLAVKVDNSPWARPHAGLNGADQVY